MNIEYPASSIQLNYLTPLLKWRVLDLKTLMKLCGFEASYVRFSLIVKSLENKEVIKSFRDPFNKRKYIFLTKKGGSILKDGISIIDINEFTCVHDSKVTEIVYQMMMRKCFNDFSVEHEYSVGAKFGSNLRPDAIIEGEKNKIKFRMAIELELTRKTKEKYISKIEEYSQSNYYDYCMYFFESENIMNSYMKTCSERLKPDYSSKILFVLNTNLLSFKFNLSDSVVLFQNKKRKINDIF